MKNISMKLNHLDYYRLPWNLTDNSISWLEPTLKCNLYCDGCYRKNEDNHKPLQLIEEELNIFTRLRKCVGVSIAGGDPLTHPEIIEIVRMVKAKGLKPILNTNGLALTKELLLELKKAGVYGFTFHRSEEHTSELQSPCNLVCRLLLEKKKNKRKFGPARDGILHCGGS